ncbi:uncharacterized protein FOMMEDRAFT_141569 [Fomitiporia mediterranea MF3/22]|uniref:uncharacterized protein n=1 Tax=Fomitiporia mediterranea (strain MF3/22) TaxID=694068 RepID=UPI0004408066|nr:uncharacterized protein FOMMEDRAFT_141569 [Fomitiporia mediterranea MF3/22]EJD00748.1 hypothetical protein FOMMEDRAFT_141569 [Fomitiporia mediterranea MF3/22]
MSSTGPAAPQSVRRETSPSPSLRERQRYVRTQSMPVVSTVPTHAHDLAAGASDGQPSVQAQSQACAPQQQQQQPAMGYPRPIAIARVAPPQFLSHVSAGHGHGGQAEKWQMTDDLQADIDRADLLHQQQRQHSRSPAPPTMPAQPAPGTAGVAYAGGAASAGAAFVSGHVKTHSAGSVSVNVGVSVGTDVVDGPSAARRRTSATEQAQHRASPLSYALRKTANTSPGYPSMPSPRSIKNKTPDRSLPVQEEPDEHEQGAGDRVSPAPSSDLNPTNDLDHDAEGTLVDLGDDDDDSAQQQRPSGESTEGEGSHTPRSPTNPLFQQGQSQRSIHEVLQPDKQQNGHHKGFSPADFQHTLKKLQSDVPGISQSNPPAPMPPLPPFSRNDYSRNESRGSYPNWMFDFYHNYPEEMEYYDEAAYMQQFMPPGSMSNQGGSLHSRPDAPIPPTPHSQTSAPTPFQHQNQQNNGHGDGNGHGQGNEQSQRPLIPPFSPAPPSGTPYPYPFSHVRRGFAYPPPPVPRVPSSVYDPSVVQEQLRLQMQMYAYNNGALSDSTLSQASTPYPGMGPAYTPFGAFLNQSRAFAAAQRARVEGGGVGIGEDGRVTSASMRSSPSHLPVPLPPMYTSGRGRGLKKRDGFVSSRGKINGTVRPRVKPPPRVDSTQPRETSPEPSSGEETAGEKYDHEHREHAGGGGRGSTEPRNEWTNGVGHDDEDNGEWVDEEEEDEEDLLELEFHPTYVVNLERRRKRWEQKWDDLVRAFQALDRETDTTLLLFASGSHTNKLHSLSSRSIRRDASLFDGHAMHAAKSAFEQIASARRSARSQHWSSLSLLERLYSSSTSASGSNSSSSQNGEGGGDEQVNEREEDLRRLLRTALHSLGALHQVYEEREMRWRLEERRMREERDGVDLLVRQAFGGGGDLNFGLGEMPNLS